MLQVHHDVHDTVFLFVSNEVDQTVKISVAASDKIFHIHIDALYKICNGEDSSCFVVKDIAFFVVKI